MPADPKPCDAPGCDRKRQKGMRFCQFCVNKAREAVRRGQATDAEIEGKPPYVKGLLFRSRSQ